MTVMIEREIFSREQSSDGSDGSDFFDEFVCE
jgi:hypothetical protein